MYNTINVYFGNNLVPPCKDPICEYPTVHDIIWCTAKLTAFFQTAQSTTQFIPHTGITPTLLTTGNQQETQAPAQTYQKTEEDTIYPPN